MKSSIFIMTHLASGWEELVEFINKNKRIHIFNTGSSYSHPDDVKLLKTNIHKFSSAAAIWGDIIFHNKDFAMRRLCQHYHLIFWSLPFDCVKNDLIETHGYKPKQAELYYNYRIEGMSQYWRRNTNQLWNPDLKDDSFLGSIL